MTISPWMLIVWSLSAAAFVALIIYRGHLTRHEIDTVFLNENVDSERELEHAEIGRQISRVDPLLKTAAVAAAFMTVLVVGLYVVKLLPTVHFQ